MAGNKVAIDLSDPRIEQVRLFKSWQLSIFEKVKFMLVLPEIMDASDWIEGALKCDVNDFIEDALLNFGNAATVEECLIQSGVPPEVFKGEPDSISLSAYLQTNYIRYEISDKPSATGAADRCFDFAAREDIILRSVHQLFSAMEMTKIALGKAAESPLEIKGEKYTLSFNQREDGDISLAENVSGRLFVYLASYRNVSQNIGLLVFGWWMEPDMLSDLTKAVPSMVDTYLANQRKR